MALKIEKVAMLPRKKSGAFNYEEFCQTLAQLDVGESFSVICAKSHFANAMTWVGYALGRKFVSRHIDGCSRIGRVS